MGKLELSPKPVTPHHALEGGRFRFWSNLKVPFYVHFWHILVIWDILSHIWWTTKQISGSKFSKNWHQKQKKWENTQKQPILDMFWCIWVTKSVSPEFCHSCKVVFCSFFADEDGWEAEKSWNSVKSGFLCQKCWFFPKSAFLTGENVPVVKH